MKSILRITKLLELVEMTSVKLMLASASPNDKL